MNYKNILRNSCGFALFFGILSSLLVLVGIGLWGITYLTAFSIFYILLCIPLLFVIGLAVALMDAVLDYLSKRYYDHAL